MIVITIAFFSTLIFLGVKDLHAHYVRIRNRRFIGVDLAVDYDQLVRRATESMQRNHIAMRHTIRDTRSRHSAILSDLRNEALRNLTETRASIPMPNRSISRNNRYYPPELLTRAFAEFQQHHPQTRIDLDEQSARLLRELNAELDGL